MFLGWDIFVSWSFLSDDDDDRRTMVWQTAENPTQFNFFEWKIENLEKLLFDTRFGQHIGISKFFPKKKSKHSKSFQTRFFATIISFYSLKKKSWAPFFFWPFFESNNNCLFFILVKQKSYKTHFFCNTRWTCHENVKCHMSRVIFFLLFPNL